MSTLSLCILLLFYSFFRDNALSATVVNTYNFVYQGCYTYNQDSFSQFRNEIYETLTQIRGMTAKDCVEFCNKYTKHNGNYTYASIVAQSTCYCFNDLINNHQETTAEKCIGCLPDNSGTQRCIFSLLVMSVYRSCASSKFAPPNCEGRCPVFCNNSTCLATGECEFGCNPCYLSQLVQKIDNLGSSSIPIENSEVNHIPSLVAYPDWGMVQQKDSFVKRVSFLGRAGGSFFLSFWKQVSLESYSTVALEMVDKKLFTTELNRFVMVSFNTQKDHYPLPNNSFVGIHFTKRMNATFNNNRSAMSVHTALYGSSSQGSGARSYFVKDDFDPERGSQAWKSGSQIHDVWNSSLTHSDVPMSYTSFLTIEFHHKCPPQCLAGICDSQLNCVYGCQPGFMNIKCQTICMASLFGSNCAKTCSSACINQSCDSVTGACLIGCVTGRMGPYCSSRCPTGKYGDECINSCSDHCRSPRKCDVQNGTCYLGCADGYQPPLCTQACRPGRYGYNCSLDCGFCSNNDICDPTTGNCPNGCEQGYYPPICACPKGYFGSNCTYMCGSCAAKLTCLGNGYCPVGCSPGYQPPYCLCPFGMYGLECDQPCGNCTNNICSPFDGLCLYGCSPGFMGDYCTQRCPIGSFGRGCAKQCGACLNSSLCNTTNGICMSGCQQGYASPLCQACAVGDWGDKCTETCGHCATGVTCNSQGICPLGCDNGYEPPFCKCPTHKFGVMCNTSCGFCAGDTNCYPNGTCGNGCMAGYVGLSCMDICPNGWYGNGCMLRCSQYCQDGLCHYVTGECLHGCTLGYAMPMCKCKQNYYVSFGECLPCGKCNGQCLDNSGICSTNCMGDYALPLCICKTGTYGPGCSKLCGYCLNGQKCDSITGVCPNGCNVSYVPPLCQTQCPKGMYGINCSHMCGVCNQQQPCNIQTGHCPGTCGAGFQGAPYCTTPCSPTKYGLGCAQTCGQCFNFSTCAPMTGICMSGCAEGYLPPDCQKTCNPGYFGYYCESPCGNCANSNPCDVINGTCKDGCAQGYTGYRCFDLLAQGSQDNTQAENFNNCPTGFYGLNCENKCGQCTNASQCGYNGICVGGCKPGYQLPYCKYACKAGFFGLNCQSKCGFCQDSRACDLQTGKCPFGCKANWFGDLCTTDATGVMHNMTVTERKRVRFMYGSTNGANSITSRVVLAAILVFTVGA